MILTEVSGTLAIIEFTINVVPNETRLVATSLGQLLGPLHLQRGGLNKANGRNEAHTKTCQNSNCHKVDIIYAQACELLRSVGGRQPQLKWGATHINSLEPRAA